MFVVAMNLSSSYAIITFALENSLHFYNVRCVENSNLDLPRHTIPDEYFLKMHMPIVMPSIILYLVFCLILQNSSSVTLPVSASTFVSLIKAK